MHTREHDWELVIASSAWERAVRRLLADPSRVIFGRLVRNEHAEGRELLAGQLRSVSSPPRGADLPPLADWLILSYPRHAGSAGTAAGWLERLRPHPRQLLVVLEIGLLPQRLCWQGWVFEQGRSVPLPAWRIAGPEMPRMERPAGAAEETDPEGRWRRTREALGDLVWGRVRRSSVTIFGASRTGSMLAWQLAQLGVRRLVLVDPDVIEPHNLDAMQGVIAADVGRPKVQALGERLLQLRPDLALTLLAGSGTEDRAAERVRGVDLLATCVDEDAPRLAATLLARRWLKVHLDVGTGVTATGTGERRLAADVRLLLPGQGCLACVGGLAGDTRAWRTLLGSRRWPGSVPRSEASDRAGSLVTLNGLAVATAVQFWLDLLAGHLRTSRWSRLRWQPGSGLELQSAAVTARPECPFCRSLPVGAESSIPQ